VFAPLVDCFIIGTGISYEGNFHNVDLERSHAFWPSLTAKVRSNHLLDCSNHVVACTSHDMKPQ
jgi:hypothetical protein